MNIYAKKGHKVEYTGASIESIRWGGCDDPRGILIIGDIYTVDRTEVHSQHTKVVLEGYDGRFNSVSFEDAP
jgi:hypothetical protein